MSRPTLARLSAARTDPDLSVKLSAHIPELLELTARKSAQLLTQFTSVGASSSSGSSVPNTGHGKGASSTRVTAAAHNRDKLGSCEEHAKRCTLAVFALHQTARLPAQQVLEQFSSPAAAAQYVGWMEELAGRILVYSQQPGSSSSQTGSGAVLARVLMGQLDCWEDLAFDLICMWSGMQRVHFQCLLAASPAAEPSGASTRGGLGSTSSSSGRSNRSAGSSTGSTSRRSKQVAPAAFSRAAAGSDDSSSKQAAPASSVAGKGGSTWAWLPMRPGADDLQAAALLQIQAAWLRPNLVRLQHAWLHRIQEDQISLAVSMEDIAQGWALVQRAPSLHPAVVQLGAGGPPVAAALKQLGSRQLEELQDVAWGYLATGSAVLRQQVLPRLQQVPGASALLHPTLRRCPRYHKGHSYGAGVPAGLRSDNLYPQLAGAYAVYLLGCELWDLWPWLLELLQPGGQQQQQEEQQQQDSYAAGRQGHNVKDALPQPTPDTSQVHKAISSTIKWCKDTLPAPPDTLWPLLPHAVPPLLCGQGGHSSSGGSAIGSHGCPSSQQVSSQLPPVSAYQLHQALELVCLNVQLSTFACMSSLQLLVLLLLRADPALRLRFMQGPQGGLLLAALQLFGCGRTPLHEAVAVVAPGLAPKGRIALVCSQGVGVKGLLNMMAPARACSAVPAASAAGLALSWLLLYPQDSKGDSNSRLSIDIGSHGTSGHNTSSDSHHLGLPLVPGPLVYFGGVSDGASGGLPLIQVPAAALQLLPGYTPHLQLAATLETLMLQGGDPSPLLGALADAYQQDPSRAPPPGSPMWLALASMAVGVRKRAVALPQQSAAKSKDAHRSLTDHISILLPLLRLAAEAQQQPGAGWGALVLGSAVQGTALVCCAAAVREARVELVAVADALCMWDMPWLHSNTLSCKVTKRAVMMGAVAVKSAATLVTKGCYPFRVQLNPLVASAGGSAAAPVTAAPRRKYRARRAGNPASAAEPATAAGVLADAPAAPAAVQVWQPIPGAITFQGAGIIPDLSQEQQEAVTRLQSDLHKMLDLLGVLQSSWPMGNSHAAAASSSAAPAPNDAAAARGLAASVSASSIAGDAKETAQQVLHHLAGCMDLCEAAASCTALCSSRLQLLGCANLSCTTPPAAGLGGCEASLVVNCRGSVCGGCGVVRYCSAACAQQDWAGHQRVCRRLAAAAAAARGCNRCAGGR